MFLPSLEIYYFKFSTCSNFSSLVLHQLALYVSKWPKMPILFLNIFDYNKYYAFPPKSIGSFINKFNVLLRRKLYIMSSTFLIIYLSIYSSVNIIYHQQNTFYNSISILTLTVIFTIIIFH